MHEPEELGRPAIIVHGGAGRVSDNAQARVDGCQEAATAGWRVLAEGGSALDAAQTAVVVLEDNPLFNAGRGAPLNAAGEIELDASIMDGQHLAAGACAAVQGIRNPVLLARAILGEGRHVLLVGEGARHFAREAGIEECEPEDLITPRQRERWEVRHGTVGCVALDGEGRLAAATSTGGLFDKHPGRVGDSALIGCGTYASEDVGASCTGFGEAIIRVVLAKTACDRVVQGATAALAADEAIHLLDEQLGAEAGIIMLDRHGGLGFAHNAPHMPVCSINAAGKVITAV